MTLTDTMLTQRSRKIDMPAALSRVVTLISTVVVLLSYVCPAAAQTNSQLDTYLNPALPLEQRVDDLVSRMTLPEKVSQMQNEAPPIARLQIPGYNWWNEGLHGVARSGYARRLVTFPPLAHPRRASPG